MRRYFYRYGVKLSLGRYGAYVGVPRLGASKLPKLPVVRGTRWCGWYEQ